MRIRLWAVIFLLIFFVYTLFGFISLSECIQQESILSCLFVKTQE